MFYLTPYDWDIMNVVQRTGILNIHRFDKIMYPTMYDFRLCTDSVHDEASRPGAVVELLRVG